MSNTYFQFKQFRIDQDKCAMKVTTDACILGAFTPVLPTVNRILDLGTGTGLLTLMLAQKNTNTQIDGIEIDPIAYAQANSNILQTQWQDRIKILQGDANNMSINNKYDLIITNPPFFKNSLRGNDERKNQAKHVNTLSNNDLLKIANNHINENGYLSILLPYPEFQLFDLFFKENGWYCFKKLFIQHKENAVVKRVVGLFSKQECTELQNEKMIIYNNDNTYTKMFTELLSPYYINL